MNKTPSAVAAIVGVINPAAATAATYNSGYIPLKLFRRYMAIIAAGTLGASGTLDAKLVAYTNASGGGAYDIPGAVITQLTKAGSDDNKQAIIDFNTDVLAGSTKYTHMRLVVTVGTATSPFSALVLGFDPLYEPASDNDLASVDEIVSV